MAWLPFKSGLALTSFRTVLPCFQQVGTSPRSDLKPALGQRPTSKKHATLINSKLEPTIWSRDIWSADILI